MQKLRLGAHHICYAPSGLTPVARQTKALSRDRMAWPTVFPPVLHTYAQMLRSVHGRVGGFVRIERTFPSRTSLCRPAQET